MAINIEWQVKPPSKVRRTSERRAEHVRAIPSEEEEGEVNRRTSERRAEHVRAIPSEEEEGEANEEKSQLFPRITDSEIINEQQLAQLMASRGSLSRGNAKAALSDLTEAMADLLREGKTVSIPMLGSFKLSIGTDAEIHPDSNRRMQSIVVKGVKFQPAQDFLDAIGKPTFVWRPTTGVAIAPVAEQLIPQLMIYFKTHDSITREDFGRTFGLKRTTAYMRLKELESMGVIQAIGNGRERKYIPLPLHGHQAE